MRKIPSPTQATNSIIKILHTIGQRIAVRKMEGDSGGPPAEDDGVVRARWISIQMANLLLGAPFTDGPDSVTQLMDPDGIVSHFNFPFGRSAEMTE